MLSFVALIIGSWVAAAEPAEAVLSATATGAPAPITAPSRQAQITATATGALSAAPAVSTSSAASSGGWADADLAWLRCKQAAHARDRDEGWTFDAWMNPSSCPGGFRTGPARDAWDRYLKRSRDYDECVRDRRTRTGRAFAFGGATGALVTTAVLGILRRGSTATKVTAAVGVGFVSGSLWWWRERGRPDPVCRAEPATEWPR